MSKMATIDLTELLAEQLESMRTVAFQTSNPNWSMREFMAALPQEWDVEVRIIRYEGLRSEGLHRDALVPVLSVAFPQPTVEYDQSLLAATRGYESVLEADLASTIGLLKRVGLTVPAALESALDAKHLLRQVAQRATDAALSRVRDGARKAARRAFSAVRR